MRNSCLYDEQGFECFKITFSLLRMLLKTMRYCNKFWLWKIRPFIPIYKEWYIIHIFCDVTYVSSPLWKMGSKWNQTSFSKKTFWKPWQLFFHFTPFVNRRYLRGDPLELTNKHSLDTKHAKTVIVSTYTQFRVILTKVSLKLF